MQGQAVNRVIALIAVLNKSRKCNKKQPALLVGGKCRLLFIVD